MFHLMVLAIASFFGTSHGNVGLAAHAPVGDVYGRCPMNNPRCGR